MRSPELWNVTPQCGERNPLASGREAQMCWRGAAEAPQGQPGLWVSDQGNSLKLPSWTAVVGGSSGCTSLHPCSWVHGQRGPWERARLLPGSHTWPGVSPRSPLLFAAEMTLCETNPPTSSGFKSLFPKCLLLSPSVCFPPPPP